MKLKDLAILTLGADLFEINGDFYQTRRIAPEAKAIEFFSHDDDGINVYSHIMIQSDDVDLIEALPDGDGYHVLMKSSQGYEIKAIRKVYLTTATHDRFDVAEALSALCDCTEHLAQVARMVDPKDFEFFAALGRARRVLDQAQVYERKYAAPKVWWSYTDEDGEDCESDYETEKQALAAAEENHSSKCEDLEGYSSGETIRADIALIQYFYDEETLERVVIDRHQTFVEYEFYHGDRREHAPITL